MVKDVQAGSVIADVAITARAAVISGGGHGGHAKTSKACMR